MPRRRPDSLAPPNDLDTESKGLWKVTIEQLEEQGTWQPSDIPTLERYIRAMERARLARDDGGLTATGSNGQLVQHPNVKTAREAERDAHQYATDLLLTPAARRRAQVEAKSDAKDPLEGALT